MRAYLLTTGVVFGMIMVAHAIRVIYEGPQLVRDPWFILITVFVAFLCVWAWRLLWASGKR
jgi:hypothetical protein